MISPFLKKLLFARQFFMIDGKIEILGKKQIMLPADVIVELEKNNSKVVYDSVKEVIKKYIRDYAKRLGSPEEGMLKSIDSLFETFGLGKMRIVDIDYKQKKCLVSIINCPDKSNLTPAVLAGIFSFLFEKNVDAEKTKKLHNTYSYMIK